MGIKINITNTPISHPRNEVQHITISMAKKMYSEPKLFIPKKNGKPTVDPGRIWYVYFYWRNDDGVLKNKFTFSKGINRLKTVSERKKAGAALKDAYTEALRRNWNPISKKVKLISNRKSKSLGEALKFVMNIKKQTKKASTITGYQFHLDRFNKWATENNFYHLSVDEFTVDYFYEFLDYLRFEYIKDDGNPLSGTSINNHMRSLSALFTALKNERLIQVNFIKDIPAVDEDVVNNKPFTLEQLAEIKNECLKTDPYLINFMSFMMYALLRPQEICRLKVRDFDKDNKFLQVETKTANLSTRRIIKKLQPAIHNLKMKGEPGSFEAFSNLDKPRDWSHAKLKSRVDSFGVRFRKIKNKLGYGREYGLYSCRHTAIINLYNTLQKQGNNEQEIISELMPITQHRSVEGLRKYLRDIVPSIPKDHSDIYTMDF